MIAVFLKPDAELDVRAIARWYDDEEPGLGDQFTDHLKAVVSRISALPNQFPTVADGVQRALVRRFPFCVYFVVESKQLSSTRELASHCGNDLPLRAGMLTRR